MAHEAGKGDKQRPTDKQKYDNNYDLIFRKKPKSQEEQEAVVKMIQLNNELYEKTVDKQK